MSHQRVESLPPLLLSTARPRTLPSSPGCPSADDASGYKTFSPLSSRRPCIAESVSAGPFTSSFNARFAPPPQTRTSAKIWPGTFIAFALSTEQLAQEYPRDSEIHRKISEYVPRRYLGLVTSSYVHLTNDDDDDDDDGDGDGDGSTVQDIIVHFVSRDQPLPTSVAHHFMPIFPVSNNDDDSDDPRALHTSILFPLVDRKQWTTFGVRLRVGSTNPSSALVFELCHEDFAHFEDKAGRDYARLEHLGAILDDEEKVSLARLLVPPFAFPAEIWLDIRNQPDIHDPPAFVEEIDFLESVVAGGVPRYPIISALDDPLLA